MTSQKSLIPFLSFVVVNWLHLPRRTNALQADVTYDSAIHGSVVEKARAVDIIDPTT
jgi:hypothetical protein